MTRPAGHPGIIPPVPVSHRALGDRTWVQLRECTYLAEAALARLAAEHELARSTLAAMERILTADPAGEFPYAARFLTDSRDRVTKEDE